MQLYDLLTPICKQISDRRVEFQVELSPAPQAAKSSFIRLVVRSQQKIGIFEGNYPPVKINWEYANNEEALKNYKDLNEKRFLQFGIDPSKNPYWQNFQFEDPPQEAVLQPQQGTNGYPGQPEQLSLTMQMTPVQHHSMH